MELTSEHLPLARQYVLLPRRCSVKYGKEWALHHFRGGMKRLVCCQQPPAKAWGLAVHPVAGAAYGRLTAARLAMLQAAMWSARPENPHDRQRNTD